MIDYIDTNKDGVINLDEMPAQSKYAKERAAIFSGEADKEKADYAANNNDYTAYLSSDYDKIKADPDKDGKVSKIEYNNYMIYDTEKNPGIPWQNIQENNCNTKHYYQLDYSFYIVIGMLCITAIVMKLMHWKPN